MGGLILWSYRHSIIQTNAVKNHVQRIVKNVVYYDVLNIIEQVGCLKQQAYDAA